MKIMLNATSRRGQNNGEMGANRAKRILKHIKTNRLRKKNTFEKKTRANFN